MLSQYRPRCPIIAVTKDARTARIVSTYFSFKNHVATPVHVWYALHMSMTVTCTTCIHACTYSQCHLYHGVHPLLNEAENFFEDVEQSLYAGIDKGKREGYIIKGSTIVLLSGWRPGPSNTNTIRIFQVRY